VEAVRDGIAALALAAGGAYSPGILLSDYNLPGNLDGLEIASRLRQDLRCEIPVIILTGDMSTETLHAITARNCCHFSKPVKLAELLRTIDDLLAPAQPVAHQPVLEAKPGGRPVTAVVFVVDDDSNIRQAIRAVLESDSWTVEDYPTCEAFLEAYRPGRGSCLLIDAYLPGMSGLELLNRLQAAGDHLPAIMITGNSDVPMAVEAMRAGASDFIEKPITAAELIASVERAIEQSKDVSERILWRESAKSSLAELTRRQREIMGLVLAGHPSKNIATDLGISQRTVENHRASIMRKTKSRSLPALARLALAAD
jgi:two-component system CheB/CheR fusion protein